MSIQDLHSSACCRAFEAISASKHGWARFLFLPPFWAEMWGIQNVKLGLRREEEEASLGTVCVWAGGSCTVALGSPFHFMRASPELIISLGCTQYVGDERKSCEKFNFLKGWKSTQLAQSGASTERKNAAFYGCHFRVGRKGEDAFVFLLLLPSTPNLCPTPSPHSNTLLLYCTIQYRLVLQYRTQVCSCFVMPRSEHTRNSDGFKAHITSWQNSYGPFTLGNTVNKESR